MRRVLTVMAATLSVAGLVLGIAPAASAADDLAGSWNAASRRDGGPGYSMKVTAADADPGNAYSAVLRFHFQDGKTGKRVKAGLLQNGSKVWMVLNGKGGFADSTNPNIMKGSIGQDGSMYFPTCYKQLAYVTKKMAPEMCLFQEFPA
jgi:hypothetical protein